MGGDEVVTKSGLMTGLGETKEEQVISERRKYTKRAGTNRKRSGIKDRRPRRNSYFHLTVRFPEDRELIAIERSGS